MEAHQTNPDCHPNQEEKVGLDRPYIEETSIKHDAAKPRVESTGKTKGETTQADMAQKHLG